MIECDFLIIWMWIAWIWLKYKLNGNVILLEQNPFSYKVWESHIPNLVDADIWILNLAPNLSKKLKSYQVKKWAIFADSRNKKYENLILAELEDKYTFHSGRTELEEFLVNELNIVYNIEKVIDVDLDQKIVRTNINTYKVWKYIIDCSWPRMFLADKLWLIENVYLDKTFHAKWWYWEVIENKKDELKVDEHTLLNQVKDNKWVWQIPLYWWKIISIWIISTNKNLSFEEYKNLINEYKHPYYKTLRLKDEKIHSRSNFSKISKKASWDWYILVWDAYAFADPVYSIWTWISFSESIYLAKKLNNNTFDSNKYNYKCRELINTFLWFFSSWYDESWKNVYNIEEINKNVLQGNLIKDYFDKYVDTIKKYSVTISNVEKIYWWNEERIIEWDLFKESELIFFFSKSFIKKEENKLKIGFFWLWRVEFEEITNKNLINVFSLLENKVLEAKKVFIIWKKLLNKEDYNLFIKLITILYNKRIIPIYFNNDKADIN